MNKIKKENGALSRQSVAIGEVDVNKVVLNCVH